MKVLEAGKLKTDFLEALLSKIEIHDEKVIVGPGIGEDAAAIDTGENLLIVKSDPITFVSDKIGWYVVNINANDIAAMGGTPRWFLATMLLPKGKATASLVEEIMQDVRVSCKELDISLIGGHTEVTGGLEHPVLCGTMLGEAKKSRLIRNGTIAEGDLLYMTKGVAIEATSVIAREKKDEVIEQFGYDFYKRCRAFLEDPGISVIHDARKAQEAAEITGMHDPTEGGVLSGAYEMAHGSGIGLRIELAKIPVFEETQRLCGYFKISPYCSIASGSLLISVAKNNSKKLEDAFETEKKQNPSLRLIGEFTRRGEPVYVVEGEQKRQIRSSGKDEITKIL